MKIFKLLPVILLVIFLIGCKSTKDEKEDTNQNNSTENQNSNLPKEVNDLTLPDGWSDDVLLKIANEENVNKPLMAIIDFESNVNIALNVNDLGITDMLTTAMFNTGKFELVERSRLATVLKEQKIANSDDFTSGNAARIGELLGADYILTGKITSAIRDVQDKYSHYELNASITFNLSAIDSSTGKIFKSVEGTGADSTILVVDDRGNVIKGPAEFRAARVETQGGTYTIVGVDMSKQFVGATKKAIENIASKLEATFPLIGYVLTGDGTKIMTDVGSKRGAKKDDYFIVIRLGKDIVHPATKKVIGKEKTVIASGIIESVGETESNAKIIKLKDPAMAPQSGDVVISISGKFNVK
ncbi:MAG: hypothetical protein A2Y34_14415 [Spirochaetes bacterium GWC1_27_15]|nr:MAG: hypothetical protein A2Z98_16975 [Spirochaetes bacterium GWB1_27_13]OHD25949.1 MAG: hypothetical protein A2Y34_14415 [Spirochaetes bacterium GWC1_27_15]